MPQWEITVDKTLKLHSFYKTPRFRGQPTVVRVPGLTEKQARINVRGIGHRGDILKIRRVV